MQALDTSTLPRHERAAAVIAHMRDIALASNVVLDDPQHAYMSTKVYDLGVVQLVHLQRSGLFMDVTRERDDQPPVIAMMLGTGAKQAREQFGHLVEARRGGVDMVELSRPHKAWSHSNRSGWALKLPADALGLPHRTVTRARPGLFESPVQAVMAAHFKTLTKLAPQLAADPAAPELGLATVALARALMSSAAGSDALARATLHEALLPRIQVFVRQHLRDPHLSPRMIATEHHISVRLLYRILAEAGIQLEQWVIDQRLEGARTELASAAARHRSIAAVAHSWGFVSASHFSRRFGLKYGVTPREWQRWHS
jgi:AraC-like DNA-binding protein